MEDTQPTAAITEQPAPQAESTSESTSKPTPAAVVTAWTPMEPEEPGLGDVLDLAAAVLGRRLHGVYSDETTVGKTGKVTLWSGLSLVAVTLFWPVCTAIVAHPSSFPWQNGLVVVVANIALVFLKNLLDEGTPNV